MRSTRSSKLCAWKWPDTVARSPIAIMSGSTSCAKPPPSRTRRPMRAPARRRKGVSASVPSRRPSTSRPSTPHSTYRKSQRLHQHDHSGWRPGRTRPSRYHFAASVPATAASATRRAPTVAAASWMPTPRPPPTRATKATQKKASSVPGHGSAKRRSSHVQRVRRRSGVGSSVTSRPNSSPSRSARRASGNGGWPNQTPPPRMRSVSSTVATPSRVPEARRPPAGTTAWLPTKEPLSSVVSAKVALPGRSRGPAR